MNTTSYLKSANQHYKEDRLTEAYKAYSMAYLAEKDSINRSETLTEILESMIAIAIKIKDVKAIKNNFNSLKELHESRKDDKLVFPIELRRVKTLWIINEDFQKLPSYKKDIEHILKLRERYSEHIDSELLLASNFLLNKGYLRLEKYTLMLQNITDSLSIALDDNRNRQYSYIYYYKGMAEEVLGYYDKAKASYEKSILTYLDGSSFDNREKCKELINRVDYKTSLLQYRPK